MKMRDYVAMLQQWLEEHPEAADRRVVIATDDYDYCSPLEVPETISMSEYVLDEEGKRVYKESIFAGKPTKRPCTQMVQAVLLG